MIVRELVTKLGYQVEASKFAMVDRQVGQLKNKLGGVTSNLQSMADGMGRLGTRMTMMFTLPLLALGGFSVKAASDAEETRNKFNTVFRDIRDEADATAQLLSDAYGQGDTQARKLLASTGDLLTGFQFTQEQALHLSKQVNTLAVDLASFQNIQGGVERASMALTKGLLGERESMKLLGIVVNENTQQFKDLVAKYQNTEGATLLQAKALATLEMAYEQSKNAMGDYARTQFTLANQMRLFRIRFKDVREAIGRMLIETLKLDKVLIGINKMFLRLKDSLDKLTPVQKRIIVFTTLFAIAIPPLLIVLSQLMKTVFFLHSGLMILKSVFGVAGNAALAFKLKLILIPAIILALIIALALFMEDLIGFVAGNESLIGKLTGKWGEYRDAWFMFWERMGGTLHAALTGNEKRLNEHLEHWKGFFQWIWDKIDESKIKFSELVLSKPVTRFLEAAGAKIAQATRSDFADAVKKSAAGFSELMTKGYIARELTPAQLYAAGIGRPVAAAGAGGTNVTNYLNLSFDNYTPSQPIAPDELADMVAQKTGDVVSKKVEETITSNPPQER